MVSPYKLCADHSYCLLQRQCRVDDQGLFGLFQIKELAFNELWRHVMATSTIQP